MPTRRNPVVRAGAILRKGGVHRQSASGHRHQGKRSVEDELDDWFVDEAADDDLDDMCSPVGESVDCSDRSRRSRRRRGWDRSAPVGFCSCGGPVAAVWAMVKVPSVQKTHPS